MPIVCGITIVSPAADPALEAALALAERAGFGPIHHVEVSLDDPDRLVEAAEAHRADLIVVAAPRSPSSGLVRLATHATVPLLIVRDPAPLRAWAAGAAPLRAALGWDESATTAAAVAAVARLRRAGPIDLELVHVYFPDETAERYGLHVTSLVDPAPELEQLLRRDIAHVVADPGGDGALTIGLVHGVGRVGDHLLEHAEATGAHVVVVGNHHREGLRRLSSVATRVVEDATASVLLVPLRPGVLVDVAPAEVRTAVVATDGTTFANCAAAYAYRLVPDRGEVHLVRVLRDGEDGAHAAIVEDLLRLHPAGRPHTRTVVHVVRDADPAHAIATAAERVGADVVCIAAHTRTGLSRLFGSSVTERLMQVCRRPVLVVHPTE